MNFQFINTPNTEPAYRSHWWIWIVLSFLVGLFHEFGHSSALVNFGGKPRQIGFGLYLIFPMFFSTVTDAWRFKKKERLLINLGGVYFEMLVAMLGLIYFIIFHDLSVLIFCFFYLITILYNLNPFIRSDGYWILSDMTNTPNLTQLSNENLKLLFSKSICRFKLKNYLLALYALLSKTYIAFIILALFVNNYSQIILFFPNLVNGISTLRLRGIGFTDVQKAIPVILFYLLLINFISDKSKLLGARLASK
jgi:putative peptide zinc metalloprotease protein